MMMERTLRRYHFVRVHTSHSCSTNAKRNCWTKHYINVGFVSVCLQKRQFYEEATVHIFLPRITLRIRSAKTLSTLIKAVEHIEARVFVWQVGITVVKSMLMHELVRAGILCDAEVMQ